MGRPHLHLNEAKNARHEDLEQLPHKHAAREDDDHLELQHAHAAVQALLRDPHHLDLKRGCSSHSDATLYTLYRESLRNHIGRCENGFKVQGYSTCRRYPT